MFNLRICFLATLLVHLFLHSPSYLHIGFPTRTYSKDTKGEEKTRTEKARMEDDGDSGRTSARQRISTTRQNANNQHTCIRTIRKEDNWEERKKIVYSHHTLSLHDDSTLLFLMLSYWWVLRSWPLFCFVFVLVMCCLAPLLLSSYVLFFILLLYLLFLCTPAHLHICLRIHTSSEETKGEEAERED